MNYPRLALFWCLLFSFSLSGQRFIPAQLDEALLQEQFLGLINSYRSENGLLSLQKDTVLTLAAKDHVRYVKSVKKLTHEEIFTGKRTPKERVSRHGGVFGDIGENIIFLPFQSDYESQAVAFFEASKNSAEQHKNISHPDFRFSGVQFAVDLKEGGIYMVQVLGGMQFDGIQGVEIVEDAYGVEPYEPTACRRLINNAYIAADLPLHLRLFGSSIYLEYHDKAVLQEIIAAPGDALAVDIIHRDQIDCGKENNFHPSRVHDGVMLQPIPYETLYSANQHPDTNRLYTYLGTIPEALKKESIQLNVIAINQNRACESNFPIGVPYGDLPLFRINPIWAFEGLDEVSSVKVEAVGYIEDGVAMVTSLQESFGLQFGKSGLEIKAEQWEKVDRFVSTHREKIDSIVVLAYSSVEGNTAGNLILQEQRAQNILQALLRLGVPRHKISTLAAENWPLFYQQILGTPWARFKDMDKAAVKRQLSDPQIEGRLFNQLAAQREAKVLVFFQQERNEAFSPYQLAQTSEFAKNRLLDLQAAINAGRSLEALELQEELIRLFLDFEVQLSDLSALHIPVRKSNLPLLSNALAVDLFFKPHIRTDQEYIHRLDSIYQLDPQYFPLQFNYLGFAVRYFYQEKKSLIAPKQLNARIAALYEQKKYKILYQDIDLALDRLMINFHLAAVDYYFYRRAYKKRDQSMRAIQGFFSEQQISEAEALSLARFFNRNYYLDWSMAIMEPYLRRKEVSEDLLLTYLQTYTILENTTRDVYYYQLLNLCLQKNKKKLCQWLSTYFQLLRDDKIKDFYCSSCMELPID